MKKKNSYVIEQAYIKDVLIPIRIDNLEEQLGTQYYDPVYAAYGGKEIDNETSFLSMHRPGDQLTEMQLGIIIDQGIYCVDDYEVKVSPLTGDFVVNIQVEGIRHTFCYDKPSGLNGLHITKSKVPSFGLGIRNEHCHDCITMRKPCLRSCKGRFVNSRRKNAAGLFEVNANLLNSRHFNASEVVIDSRFTIFNLIGTGDVCSRLQVENLFKIAIRNSNVMFSMRTSNTDVFTTDNVPGNVTVVYNHRGDELPDLSAFKRQPDKIIVGKGLRKEASVYSCDGDCRECKICFKRCENKLIYIDK